MEWPYRRFLKAWDAFQRRSLCEEWTSRKIAHISALYANTNMDDPKNDRQETITKLERSYDEIVARIWNGPEESDEQEEMLASNPFFAASKRNVAIATQKFEMPGAEVMASLPE